MKLLVGLMVCSASLALAQEEKKAEAPAVTPTTLTGSQAKPLVRALKYSGIAATKAKTTTTWKAKLLRCTTPTSEDPMVLDETTCQADAKKITGAAAIVLEAAMNEVGIPAPYMMGKKEIKASMVTCTHDTRARNEGGPFVCTYTPMGR